MTFVRALRSARSPRFVRAGSLVVLAVLAWLLPYQLNVYWISW